MSPQEAPKEVLRKSNKKLVAKTREVGGRAAAVAIATPPSAPPESLG